jgi:uncharacterized membrane protein YeaQ/YmgE (transglycosylase-associated protein family)
MEVEMGVLSWLAVGLIAGVLVTALHRTSVPGGYPVMIGLGAIGGVIGGVVAVTQDVGSVGSLFEPGGLGAAAAGALLLLALYSIFTGDVRFERQRTGRT